MSKTKQKKELNRFAADRKKFFTNNCNYIKISDKDAERYFFHRNNVLDRLNNLNYMSYTLFLAQFLNRENKLVTVEARKKKPLQKQDLVELLYDRFGVAKKTVENYLSAAKKANVLIKTKGNELVQDTYIMNPVAFNAGFEVFFAELMFYFSDDLIKLLSPYQYLACAKIVNVDYPKVNECKYLPMIDRTRYNIDKIMNGEMFEVEGAFETPRKMKWNEAKKFFLKNGISKVIGIPSERTKFNCIFHNDEKQTAMVIYQDSKEKYYCIEDHCVSGSERLGLDVLDMLYILMDIEQESNKMNLAMEYLANLYNVEIEETVISLYQKSNNNVVIKEMPLQ